MIIGAEKEGCRKILSMLRKADVVAIKDTVTKRLVATPTIEEAVDVILTYSTSAEELLSRQKLTKAILFQYLYEAKVPISSQSLKPEIIGKIIALWHKPIEAPITAHGETPPPSDTATTETGQQMASQFIQWFYPMLNSLGDPNSTSNKAWGAQNFWPDASLGVTLLNELNEELNEKYSGAEAAQEKLASIVIKDKAVLNPNPTPEGYRGAVNPHGLAKLVVCGTLHSRSLQSIDYAQNGHSEGSPTVGHLVGVFEQFFGLIRDPMDGNRWKIKFTELKIKLHSSNEATSISLSDGAIRSILD